MAPLVVLCAGVQTSVISVTLNGERQKLQMTGGTSEQVDCLCNADAYMPSADLSTDVAAALLHSQVHLFFLVFCRLAQIAVAR